MKRLIMTQNEYNELINTHSAQILRIAESIYLQNYKDLLYDPRATTNPVSNSRVIPHEAIDEFAQTALMGGALFVATALKEGFVI